MSDHAGVAGDEAFRVQNLQVIARDSTLMLCEWCGGTGNEFYAMYRRCPECGGVGVVDREGDESDAK